MSAWNIDPYRRARALWTLLTPGTAAAAAATASALSSICASVITCSAGRASFHATWATNALTTSAPAASAHHSDGKNHATAIAATTGTELSASDPPRGSAGNDEQPLLENNARHRDRERERARQGVPAAAHQRYYRVARKLPRGECKRDGDEEGDERLDLAVAIGMVLVRRSHPVPDAEDQREVCDQVGGGMDRVSDKRLRGEHKADHRLRRCDRYIHRDAEEGYPPDQPDPLLRRRRHGSRPFRGALTRTINNYIMENGLTLEEYVGVE